MNGNYTNAGDVARNASWVNVLAGAWLIISPWVVGFGALQAAMLDTLIVGIAVLILALVRVGMPTPAAGASWINFVLGLWLIISPFVLQYSNSVAAAANDVIVGIIVAVFALWSALGAGLGTYTTTGRGQPSPR